VTAQALSVYSLWGATSLYVISMLGYAFHAARVADARGRSVDVPTSSRSLGIGRATVIVGAVLHLVGVVARGVEAGHVPWSSMYEYTITGSLVVIAVFLVLARRRDAHFLGAFATGIASLSLGLALPLLYSASDQLQPALQSYWLVVHVSIAILATGIFAIGFAVTVIQLLRRSPRLNFAPPEEELEAMAFRLHAFGFVLWTFTVIAGAIWANEAWGRPWGWDPKEVWSFVIWALYAGYLHARTTRGWAGRRAAWLSVAGFAALIINFTVVNLVIQGLHSYAGV